MLNMITEINQSKTLKSIYHANVNVNLMEENVIPINGGITINVDARIENVLFVKKLSLASCYMQKWKVVKRKTFSK